MVRALLIVSLVAIWCAGCDDDGNGDDLSTGSLWVRYAVENEVGQGSTAYVTFYDGTAEGDSLELLEDDIVTCNGKRLEVNTEAWSRITYYKAIVPDLGAGGSYNFSLTRGTGEAHEESLSLPSTATIESFPPEVQPGTDVEVTISGGEADELQVAVVAPCLAVAEVSLGGDAETATISGDDIICACAAGGNTPPCDGLIRAQRISRGEVGTEFAGGETLGVQRHEVDVAVIPE